MDRRIREVCRQQAPALGGEVAFGDRQTTVERLISQSGLAETRKLTINRRGETLASGDATGMKNFSPGARWLGRQYGMGRTEKWSRREHAVRVIFGQAAERRI